MVERMFVLGIDPGLSRCGYGLVTRSTGSDRGLRAVAAGVIETEPDEPLPARLFALHRELRDLFAELRPAVAVVERVFFQVNAKTAVSVCQASGLALSVAAETGCDVVQYSANEVKQAVVGYGSATKAQVQHMVAKLTGLASPPRPPDAADALALAICHLHTASLANAVAASDARIGAAR
jgi:crossover junction endodeoxyribonuclease RuvC